MSICVLLSAYLSAYLSVYLSVDLYIDICVYLYMPVYLLGYLLVAWHRLLLALRAGAAAEPPSPAEQPPAQAYRGRPTASWPAAARPVSEPKGKDTRKTLGRVTAEEAETKIFLSRAGSRGGLTKELARLYLSDMGAAVTAARRSAAGEINKLEALKAFDTVQSKLGTNAMIAKIVAYINADGPGVHDGVYVPCERRFAARQKRK